MPTTEHTINDALAAALRKTRRAWANSKVVSSENTGMLKGSNRRPDLLVLEANVSPVCIETEITPATTVESDAVARLGEKIRTNGRIILSSVAVRLPPRLREKQARALRDDIANTTDFEIALYTGASPASFSRWPRSGWLNGSISDLSILTQSASVPPEVIKQAVDELVNGVSEAAGLLGDIAQNHPGAIHKISEELRQEDGEQTRGMAATILANAFVFQETLAGGPGKLTQVKSIDEMRTRNGALGKPAVLSEWGKILTVNYWPIFDIARRILEVIPAGETRALLERLSETATKLVANRLMRSHDLTGAVFQRLIADRKFLAAFYTTPAAAALLAGLAIKSDQTPGGGFWSDVEAVKNIRVADFACGTGTLVSTAYQRIGQLHEIAGGDAERLHPEMMANGLTGCDVLPAAAHLTASMLAGAHPTVTYNNSSILTVVYGKQPDGAIALGSLDLLDPQRKFGVLDITAKVIGGMGEGERETWESLPHASFDLIIMNPPFTRATGHEGKKIGIPVPMFAAFSSSEEEQRQMSKATQQLTRGTSAHGNAGEASIFLVLADRKLKTGGVLALVMPLSLVSGDAWDESRILLAKNYSDIIIASIAGTEGSELSFSADTDMGECLVIARKTGEGSQRATFVTLAERPAFPLLGAEAARQIRQQIEQNQIRRLEDGPVGGTVLRFGDDAIGQTLTAPLPKTGGWNVARIADLSLAQTAFQLTKQSRVWLPTMKKADAVSLPITTIGQIANIGPYHADINGVTQNGAFRGPFDVFPIRHDSVPTYPVLWSHNAENERHLAFNADYEAQPRHASNPGDQEIIDSKVDQIWRTASHCHFNQNFRFNSQSTAMQFTLNRTIGGRAWLSVSLSSADHEKTLVLWGNTSLGLLAHWWHANKQQPGRGSIGKSALQTLPVLDVTTLSSDQISAAVKLFDSLSRSELAPLHQIDSDLVRRELDNKFAQFVLGLGEKMFRRDGPLDLLRSKLAREPSIRGSKSGSTDDGSLAVAE